MQAHIKALAEDVPELMQSRAVVNLPELRQSRAVVTPPKAIAVDTNARSRSNVVHPAKVRAATLLAQ